ncbi:hypothetical protein [Streptomyces hesseae]|uniref:Uncharacterized protein n=1 Tax=Streptomyces hesseae TaxID=3075519 RepID=A0ABU2SN01_9ACTN|nr:hypothetical protein [Streptomyces sp. DSM 40473]MDT0450356.1 hypothetical protein [Streptomyces sp. DSM 40473]
MDDLRAGLPFRAEYRAALGLTPGRKLLALTSTWGPHSLLGANMDLVRRALAELPPDEYRVLAAVHPNVWYGHGGWQLRAWLAPYLRSGLLLPAPETDTWKAALVAADAFIGDHGSLTLYAAALGVPGLLGAFGDEVVAAGSPMARLGAALPRVAPDVPLGLQLRRAAAAQAGDERLAEIGDLVTSRPMQAAGLLRRLYYERMELDEPASPAVPRPVALPLSLPAERYGPVPPPMFVDVGVDGDVRSGTEGAMVLRRYLASLQGAVTGHLTDPHLVVAEGEPDGRWAGAADVVLARAPGARETYRAAAERVFAGHGGCWLVAFPDRDGAAGCVAVTRDGGMLSGRWEEGAMELGVAASVLYAVAVGGAGSRAVSVRVGGGEGMLRVG